MRHSDVDRGEAHIARLVLSFESYRVHSLLPSPTSLSSDKYSSVRSYLEVGSSIPGALDIIRLTHGDAYNLGGRVWILVVRNIQVYDKAKLILKGQRFASALL